MPTLYYAPKACSLAPHILLEESGLPYRTERVDVFAGENLRPEYLAVNPRARVPALKLDTGEVLTEVTALLHWISEQVPERAFIPAAGIARARCNELMGFLASRVHPSFAQLVRPDRFSESPEDHPRITSLGARTFRTNLALLDAMLSKDGPWALGPDFTAADPYVLVFARCADYVGAETRDLASLQRCVTHLMERPAVLRTIAAEGLEDTRTLRAG